MDYMATWAATLTGMVEGKKIEHGQSRRIEIDGGGMLFRRILHASRGNAMRLLSLLPQQSELTGPALDSTRVLPVHADQSDPAPTSYADRRPSRR